MTTKDFCPIMTIGFEAPDKGKRDNRLCKTDCAWYNLSEQVCNVNVIADSLARLETMIDDLTTIVTDLSPYAGIEEPYDDYGDTEEEEYDSFGISEET